MSLQELGAAGEGLGSHAHCRMLPGLNPGLGFRGKLVEGRGFVCHSKTPGSQEQQTWGNRGGSWRRPWGQEVQSQGKCGGAGGGPPGGLSLLLKVTC